jgi:hypothetical protein
VFAEDDDPHQPRADFSEAELTIPTEAELTRPVQYQVQTEQMRQAKVTFNAAIVVGVIGTLVLLLGVGVSFFSIGTGGVSSTAAGIVLDTLSFFAIKFHRETNQRLDEIRRDESAIALVAQISDVKKRDDAIGNLVKGLRTHTVASNPDQDSKSKPKPKPRKP